MTDDRISEFVDPAVVELYMLGHGWDAVRRTGAFSVWSHPNHGGDVALFLPLSRVPDDYEERLAQFVQRLSSIEETDWSTMLTNLRYAASDLVRVRLVSPRVGLGELPITDGAKLFGGTRDLIQAAASAAIEHRPAYGPKKHSTVVDYIDSVRLGQTERGSYVVTVISEVEPDEQGALLPDEAAHLQIPFERRVTTQLVLALEAVHDAAGQVLAGAPVDVFEDVIDQGVSANLCDALQIMGEESVSSALEISVDWAASRPPTVTDQRVTLEPEVMPVLPEASKTLKKLGPFDDVEVVGVVGILDRRADDEVGTIVIEGVAMGARRNVRIDLDDTQYHRAIEAHDEKRTVAIRGTLVKEGKSWRLLDPGPLRVQA
ncbi:MAG TPA: hypothetical protein VLJ80_07435 [Solirubrobacteraceae bacterium]|nr:hypothetical protein [Solirubrobacteraceae bacterium]